MSGNSNTKTMYKLLAAVVLMFAFGFALVPLYDVFCAVTGLNGKTSGRYENPVPNTPATVTRDITIQFLTLVNGSPPLHFYAKENSLTIIPGIRSKAVFFVQNHSDREMHTQAIPSLSPSLATQYLHKIECFCFENQLLQAGEKKEMTLTFFVDAEIPVEINTLSLAYTMFDITPNNI